MRHILICLENLPKILILLVNDDICHLLETSLEYFGHNKFRKVIDNIFIILSYEFWKNIVQFSAFCGTFY